MRRVVGTTDGHSWEGICFCHKFGASGSSYRSVGEHEKMSISTLEKYVQKMERLRVDRAHGKAPHQPLLLLAVIELIEQGHIYKNRISLSPDLAETFLKYWTKVVTRSET